MSRYLDEASAAANGYRLVHEPAQQRFAVYFEAQSAADSAAAPPKLMGEAHYSLLGDSGIDFDHTLVSPELRGTGIAGLLAQHALTSDVVTGREIQASCWFIEGYLEKHPELLTSRA